MTPRCSPGALASLLEALAVRVEAASVERTDITLADYPGGPRPSSVVRLSGAGCSGLGENVAFFEAEHDRFAAHVSRWFEARTADSPLEVGSALGAEGTPYERAALQAALVDLALRQAGLSLYDLTGVREASLRFVRSLAANAEPGVVISRLRAEGFSGDLKVDVDASWPPSTVETLAKDVSIAIFDFKGRADATLARQLYTACPTALLEDPPSDFQVSGVAAGSRISRDATLPDTDAVARARTRGEAVNLKAARMGGPLAVLRGLECALATGEALPPVRAYLGGMFEVSVARLQARQLAALYCASAPNDLALNVPEANHGSDSPAVVRLDRAGFGSP